MARRNLIPFTEYTNDSYQCAEHHQLIADKLEAVERGEINRLMIFMPPRHGKSELASRRFPAWYLGRNPKAQIIAASYNSDLATDFGRDVRNIVALPEYNEVFTTGLKPDSKAANRWNTTGGGSYIAAGVGTAVTGRGANLGIIDDPLKDRKEADSETTRENLWDWYRSTFRTRLMPGGAIILIQTRWHEDDLAGRLLSSEGAEEWEILELPALDNGEALWPEWYPVEELEKIKRDVGPREWTALYQQRPQPDDGEHFKKDWFNRYSKAPEHLNIYITSDYAVTEDDGDYTEHTVWGVDPDDNLYSLDNWSGQKTPDVWIDAFIDLVEKWKPLICFGESGVIRRSIESYLKKRMAERRVYFRMEWEASMHDKVSRSRSFQARAASGKVYLPDDQEGDRQLDQLIRFPTGKHDDFVDTCSLMGQALDETYKASIPKPQPVKPPTDYRPNTARKGNSWRTI